MFVFICVCVGGGGLPYHFSTGSLLKERIEFAYGEANSLFSELTSLWKVTSSLKLMYVLL